MYVLFFSCSKIDYNVALLQICAVWYKLVVLIVAFFNEQESACCLFGKTKHLILK